MNWLERNSHDDADLEQLRARNCPLRWGQPRESDPDCTERPACRECPYAVEAGT